MDFTNKEIRSYFIWVLLFSFLLPLMFYQLNLLQFATFVDFYFEFIHMNNNFNDSPKILHYIFILLVAILGILTTKIYKLKEKKVYSTFSKSNFRIGHLDFLVLLILISTGWLRIRYNIGHSQFVSELPFSGIIHYFSTSFLYSFFIYRVLKNRSRNYFLSGILIISIIETNLLWRGFVLSIFVWYFILFIRKLNLKAIFISLSCMTFLYTALSNFRNNTISSDNTEFSSYSSVVTVLNRFQGFTRAYVVVNSNLNYDNSRVEDPIKQIDSLIWQLKPEIKNSIGGSTLGLLYFVGGVIAVFFYFHCTCLLFIILNTYGKTNLVLKTMFVVLSSQFNLILIEGVGSIYFISYLVSFIFILMFHQLSINHKKI